MLEKDEMLLKGQSSHLPHLGDIRSQLACEGNETASFQPSFDVSGFARVSPALCPWLHLKGIASHPTPALGCKEGTEPRTGTGR